MTPTGSSEAKGLLSAKRKGEPKGRTKTSKGCSSKAKAKSMPKGKKKEAALESSREARRQAMLAAVPKKVQLQFQNGCSKCRYTRCTVSCWRSRGFESTYRIFCTVRDLKGNTWQKPK